MTKEIAERIIEEEEMLIRVALSVGYSARLRRTKND